MPPALVSRFLRSRGLALGGVLLVGLAGGAALNHFVAARQACSVALPANGQRAQPGPWGELSYTSFTIAAPEEALPIRALETQRTRWLFPKATEADIRGMLEQAGVSAAARELWLQPEVLHIEEDGVDLTPSLTALLDLSAEARQQLYQHVAEVPANGGALTYLHKDTLDDRFAGSDLAPETLSIFRKLCCEHGDYLVFAGLETMLAELPTYEQKVRFMKALTRQKTMLLQLHVGPESDIPALVNYWGKGAYATDVRTKLESVAKVKGGTWLDVLLLLPPLPSAQLYSYPISRDNPLAAPPVVRDCHWTSLNFFRQIPDPTLSDVSCVREQLQQNYYPAPGDPRYGDLVLLTKPDGTPVHSATYLADDIVFTKNGSTIVHPWMLSTTADLLKRYSFQVPAGQRLTVTYLRKIAW